MTFSTEKNKSVKIWNDSIGNQFKVDDLSSNDKIIFTKVSDLNNINMVYNNVVDFSTDFIIPTIITLKNDTDFILDMFQEFEIVFNRINKNLIPYIKTKIIYRLGDSIPSITVPLNNDGVPFDETNTFEFEINDMIEIKEVILEEDEIIDENIKNVTYRSSISLREGGGDSLPPELQLRFFANITNPNYYQST